MIPARGAAPLPRSTGTAITGAGYMLPAWAAERLQRHPEFIALRRRLRGDDPALHRELIGLAEVALLHASGSACGQTAAPTAETDAPSGWLSTKQVADALGVEPRTVRYWIGRGLLPARRHGDTYAWLVTPEELEVFRRARDAA